MIDDKVFFDQLKFCLDETALRGFGDRYVGKVRDCYRIDDRRLMLVTTDRLSCFDKVVTTVPFKGQILNTMALYWLKKAHAIIPTHLIDSPHPNVTIGKAAQPLPVEVVVRGYITGSAWNDYNSGKTVSGVSLPAGLRKNQKLAQPILTPATKAAKGEHDLPISEDEIVSTGLVSKKVWDQVRSAALALFQMGAETVGKQGLILVDTKYEFGVYDDQVILIDEVHTLDCSRYWMGDEYEARFASGREQVMLDKQLVREWLLTQGFSGEGPIPHFDDTRRVDIAKHYVNSFRLITGQDFVPVPGDALVALQSLNISK